MTSGVTLIIINMLWFPNLSLDSTASIVLLTDPIWAIPSRPVKPLVRFGLPGGSQILQLTWSG